MYMMWFDDSTKKATDAKIEEAIAAYMKHFKSRPNVVLVNIADRVEYPGMRVRCESYVRPNNFWVGWEEAIVMAS